jgi:ABC-2 type transport system ATP-binding protein
MVSHVGIIFKGRLIFQGPLSELQSFQQKASRVLIKTSDNETTLKLLQEYEPERAGDAVSVPFESIQQVAAINRTLTSHNLDVYLLHPKESDLEQLFIDLTTTQ